MNWKKYARQCENDLDFTTMLSPHLMGEGVYQVTSTSAITFRNCTFKGKVTSYTIRNDRTITITCFMQSLSFIDCVFEDEFNLRAGSIRGRADFSKSAFLKKSNFEESTFFDDTYFSNCIFYEEARFQNSFFNKKLFAIQTEFQKVCGFQNATFMADTHFSMAKFYAYADLSLATFHQHAFFNYAEFNTKANFNKSTFRGRCEFMNALIYEGSLKDCAFWGESKFNTIKINKSLSLENALFMGNAPNLDVFEKINFDNTCMLSKVEVRN